MPHTITGLDAFRASGPDGISVQALKGTAVNILSSLSVLFNISIAFLTMELLEKAILFSFKFPKSSVAAGNV